MTARHRPGGLGPEEQERPPPATRPGPGPDSDDLAAVLAVANRAGPGGEHEVTATVDVRFTWDYRLGARPRLARLYGLATQGQWSAGDLPWHTEVDPEAVAAANRQLLGANGFQLDVTGTAFERWGEAEWLALGVESQNWMLSQFLHGEQGALLCTARLAETVPSLDAKLTAASQMMDEARHVEVFARYLQEKLAGHYPVNAHLGALLDDIVAERRWDMVYLGMQVLVEGLALAAFGFLRETTTEPLLAELLRRVMADEARHVAFGVLALEEVYRGLTRAERRERQELVLEAVVRMRDRLLQQEVWERLGVPAEEAVDVVRRSPERQLFQRMLFARVVPACKRLGLLDPGDPWLRDRFAELEVIELEDLPLGADGLDDPGVPGAGPAAAAPGTPHVGGKAIR